MGEIGVEGGYRDCLRPQNRRDEDLYSQSDTCAAFAPVFPHPASINSSAMRSLAFHCSSISSLDLELSVALMCASASWDSGYSGSCFDYADLSDLLGGVPRGGRLRTSHWTFMLPPMCKKFSE